MAISDTKFSIPGGFHRWRENVRMSSMMAPGALRWPDGRLLAFGSGGSNRIRSSWSIAATAFSSSCARLGSFAGRSRSTG